MSENEKSHRGGHGGGSDLFQPRKRLRGLPRRLRGRAGDDRRHAALPRGGRIHPRRRHMAAASVVRPPAQGGDLRKDAAEGRGIHLPLPLVGRGEGRRAGDGDADHRKVRRRRARRHRAPPRLAVRHQGRDQKAGRGDQRVLPLAVRHARGAHLLPRILRRGAVGQNLPAVRRGARSTSSAPTPTACATTSPASASTRPTAWRCRSALRPTATSGWRRA